MERGREIIAKRAPWWRRHIVPLVIAIVVVALVIDAFVIEPDNVQVNHYVIHANVASPLKIADLSDLHTRGLGRPEREVLAAIAKENPDVILITGDTLADPLGNYMACMKVYKQLHAPLGVWFVRGNWENLRPLRHERQFYRDAGVNLLLNQNHELRPDVWLMGLDDPFTGRPNLAAALQGVPTNVYTIAMFHSPFFFQTIVGKVNLVLAGHTHGGQIRIPFVKPFWLPGGSGPFLDGWYEEKNSRMYVNRGVGMSDIPARFLCRPEVAFITLEP
ncbi:MAG: metallophosphoesterase [Candidatus Acidiferrales bacterium]